MIAEYVTDHGAATDGSDATEAIEAAAAEAWQRKVPLAFPPGLYTYSGEGLDPTIGAVDILGGGRDNTVVQLATESYLLRTSRLLARLRVQDLKVSGGKGAIRHDRTASNVAGPLIVQRTDFVDYTECAVALNSVDVPYLTVEHCQFKAASYSATIGIAAGTGDPSATRISGCSFLRNEVDIKLPWAGLNCQIVGNDFLRLNTNRTAPQIRLWLVPTPTTGSAGDGLTVMGNKFGPEYQAAGDYQIVCADESAGSSVGERLPDLSTASSGHVRGSMVAYNSIAAGWDGSGSAPVVFSTTPNLSKMRLTPNHWQGSDPTFLVEYLDALGKSDVAVPAATYDVT